VRVYPFVRLIWYSFTAMDFHTILGKIQWWPISHTQWQGRLFTTAQLLYQRTDNLYVYHCQWLTDTLFVGLFSWACLMCSSAWVVFIYMGSGVTGQVFTQLEIAIWLAWELDHWIGYYLWYLELKWVLNKTIWPAVFSLYVQMEKLPLSFIFQNCVSTYLQMCV